MTAEMRKVWMTRLQYVALVMALLPPHGAVFWYVPCLGIGVVSGLFSASFASAKTMMLMREKRMVTTFAVCLLLVPTSISYALCSVVLWLGIFDPVIVIDFFGRFTLYNLALLMIGLLLGNRATR